MPEQDAIDQVLHAMPHHPPLAFPPLRLADWKQALKSARKRTMRGADSWSIQELSWLSDEFTSLLLLISQEAERLQAWPEQLTMWVLVLLREGDDPCPGWSMIRPITVAGVCYRIWSRIRTAQLLSHAKSMSKPLVSPLS